MKSNRILFGSTMLVTLLAAALFLNDPTVGQTKKKIGTDYTEETAPAANDYFHMVKSGGGAGTDRNVKFTNVPKALLASIANGHLLYNNNGVFESPTITSPLTAANGAVSVAGLSSIGTATYIPRVNAAGTAWEYRSPAQMLADISALSSTIPGSSTELLYRSGANTLGATTATWDSGTSTLTTGTIKVANSGAASELQLLEPSGSGTNYTAFKTQAQAGNVTYTLPATDGAIGYQLTTNGSGALSWAAAGSGGGLTKFTEAESTSSPNATVYVDSLTAAGASTNADAAIVPKGTGALLADIPDSAASGGNKRGANAVDWQTIRSGASQVASGTTSTISGGENSTASGAYAVVSGGYGHVSSGDYATVGGGLGNVASAAYATASGGDGNNATATYATVAGGRASTASGTYSTVIGGHSSTASGSYSSTIGKNAVASLYGEHTQANGRFSTDGDAQTSVLVARNTTTNGLGGTSLKLDGASARMVLPANTAWQAQISIVARHAATGDSASWTYTCLITRDGSNNTAIPGNISNSPVQTDYSGSGSAWTISVTADDTNEALQIGVTGETAKTIKWVARIELTEVTG